MKIYQWILFDADETLFDFDAFSGLKLMFLAYNMEFNADDFHEYQTINKCLWIDYQNGKITAQQLKQLRFSPWTNKLKVSPYELNSAFMSTMAKICAPLDGAISLLNSLQNKVKLGIITNGFTELQQLRLERAGLTNHFDVLVISEQVGIAKPHPDIFEYALSCMGNPDRQQVLMVGDNPDSDILGGINAGIDTCWLNIHNKSLPDNITPLYQVPSLAELEKLLLKHV